MSSVDGILLALAERHGLEDILTVDGAPFRAVRLDHGPPVTVV